MLRCQELDLSDLLIEFKFLSTLRAQLSLNSGQFRARFIFDVVHAVGAAIPIAGVA